MFLILEACPYYMSHVLHETADVVICPYNYVLDRGIRKAMKISLNKCVLIIDEAHNVESCCQDSASRSFTAQSLDSIDFKILIDLCKIVLFF